MAAVPELLDALRGDNSPGALVSTRAILAPVFNLPALGGGDAAAWDAHRELVVTAWFAVCH
jgi:hypothetical protein